MNADLVSDLEQVRQLLENAACKAESDTVSYEINTAKQHVYNAIEWEKNMP